MSTVDSFFIPIILLLCTNLCQILSLAWMLGGRMTEVTCLSTLILASIDVIDLSLRSSLILI